jgi:PleD family two-component response regulator
MVPVGSPTSGSILENRRSIRIEGGSRDPSPSPKITISEPGSPMLDAEHDRSSFASMHVLVAEDNFVSQRVLAKRLTQLGYTVVVASNGQEAHDKFLTSSPKFDVILMDMKVYNHPACEA